MAYRRDHLPDGQPQSQLMNASSVLCGWKEIASYLSMSVRSAQRYERTNGLPVTRVTPSSRGAVFAMMADLEKWLTSFDREMTGATNVWKSLQTDLATVRRLHCELNDWKSTFRASMQAFQRTLQDNNTLTAELSGQLDRLGAPHANR